MSDDIQTLRRQLLQLKELHAGGALDAAAFEASRTKLERRLVDAVLVAGNDAPAATAAASASATTAATAAPPRTSRKLIVVLGLVVLVVASAGYLWTGAPRQAGEPVASGEAASTSGSESEPHAMSFEQIAAMAERLAQRLKEQPADPEGWAMLARSYTVLGRTPEAVDAYKKAVELRGDDAALLADYADALAVKNDRKLTGEPLKLVEAALKLEPNNLKALSLAGTAAFDRKDYAAAVTYWEKIIQTGPSDNALVQQVQGSLAEARELGGLPSPKPAAGSSDKPAASLGAVSGTVTLSSALAKQAGADDTVFIFARAVDGPPMPLAVLRKTVKDLPLTFTLDDSMAMSPAAKLSGAGKVTVSARVSKSGNAIAENGDLMGQSAPVGVGAVDVKIDIDTVVKK